MPDHIRKKLTGSDDSYVIKNIEFRVTNNAVVTCVSTKPDEPTKLARNKPKRHSSNKRRKKIKAEYRHIEEKYSKNNKKGGYR